MVEGTGFGIRNGGSRESPGRGETGPVEQRRRQDGRTQNHGREGKR